MDMEQAILQAPFSLEAEQSVLGSVLIEPACLPEVSAIVRPDDFYVESNREIFEIMCDMFAESETIDVVTLLERMRSAGMAEKAGGRSYLVQLAEFVPTTANVARYARIIEEKAQLRRLIAAAREISDECHAAADDVEIIMDAAEQRIYEITASRVKGGFSNIKDVILETYDRLYKLAGDEREQYLGIKTGFYDLDRLLVGMNRGDLIFVAGRPGMGKTSFAMNVAQNVAERYKCAVCVFSLEMSKEQLVSRMLSTEAGVESMKLRMGTLADGDWARLAKASATLSEAHIKIDDAGGETVTAMKGKLRREKNLGLVIIDHLQLMQGGTRRSDNRVQEISEITRNLKIMAKELGVPVMVLSQLSRGPESRKPPIPMLSDLRESGSIEQDADVVLFLYREDYYDPETEKRNMCEVIVAKNRSGPTGRAELIFLQEFTKFENAERKHDD